MLNSAIHINESAYVIENKTSFGIIPNSRLSEL